ncbi:MAG: hypothetical protein DIZ80_08240, partial [endosymbiont of Galathealinum brachiosum]
MTRRLDSSPHGLPNIERPISVGNRFHALADTPTSPLAKIDDDSNVIGPSSPVVTVPSRVHRKAPHIKKAMQKLQAKTTVTDRTKTKKLATGASIKKRVEKYDKRSGITTKHSTLNHPEEQNERSLLNHAFSYKNSVDIDAQQNYNPQIASSQGKPIKRFMETSEQWRILINQQTTLDSIPVGRKDNVYYLVNAADKAIQQRHRKLEYEDDCGAWDSKYASTKKTFFIVSTQDELKFVKKVRN